MILIFGVLGFFITQLGFAAFFSATVAPWLGAVTLALGLGYVGMAFSEWKYRRDFPLFAFVVLALIGSLNIVFHGRWWFSFFEYLFAASSGTLALRMLSPRRFEEVYSPVRHLLFGR